VRWRLLDALGQAIDLGQVLAMPSLPDVVSTQRRRRGDVPFDDGRTWLEIDPGWVVFDRERRKVGTVGSVRGDRITGELDGIDVATAADRPDVVVTPNEIATIGTGEIVLR
jgi:hypothetical protein